MLSDYALACAENARAHGCHSRAENYVTAVRAFTSTIGDMPLGQVTEKTVMIFEQKLADRGLCMNTISCYIRCLRAVYNKAVADGRCKDRMPFRHAFTGQERTAKRSLTEAELKKILHLPLPEDSPLALTRDLFAFSFYALGMPFVDVVHLRKEQISGNVVVYHRQKTGQMVRVPLSEAAQEILQHYNNPSAYVFPVLKNESRKEYVRALGQYNRHLKRLAKMAGLSVNLTSYCVRHSWASMAYRSSVSINTISQALGHTNTNTTMTYIRELDDEYMRLENEKIIHRLNGLPSSEHA
ncbi:tyrosine-type recombinase/integrase [Prevotella sp. AGR2160]|uniref:tyrosine-type recombinase/integrase n=1 Tax=Prevotella sp. AGR2160 TaxID=1280674 RepID=UPI0004208F50|nr:site-specific integrase [Prevotella sp. AGR2160]